MTFTPTAVTQLLVNGVSQSIEIPATGSPNVVSLSNVSDYPMYVLLGTSPSTSVEPSYGTVILPFTVISLDIGSNTYIAAILDSQQSCSGVLSITAGVFTTASVTVSGTTVSSTATSPLRITVGTVATQVLAANTSRKRMDLQNVGTIPIFLALGATPTTTNFHRSLPAGGSTGDGSSPTYSDDMWQGSVSVICNSSGGLLQVVELS